MCLGPKKLDYFVTNISIFLAKLLFSHCCTMSNRTDKMYAASGVNHIIYWEKDKKKIKNKKNIYISHILYVLNPDTNFVQNFTVDPAWTTKTSYMGALFILLCVHYIYVCI